MPMHERRSRQQMVEDEILDRYRAIADFVRTLLMDVLVVDGPQTTSQLRRKVPASKGSLRWDLKRLEAAGFIEAEGDSSDPTWRAIPGAVMWTAEQATHPRMSVIVTDLERVVTRRRIDRMQTWMTERYTRRWKTRWSDASISRDYLLRLTPADLEDLDEHIDSWVQAKRASMAGRDETHPPAEEESVFVTVSAFPFRVGRQ